MARKFSLIHTLALLVVLCGALSPVVEANNLNSHARMIRKRQGLGGLDVIKPPAEPSIPLIGAGADPSDSESVSNTASASQSASESSKPSATRSTPTNTATQSGAPGLSLSIPIIGSLTETSSSSSSSSSSTSGSTTSTSSSESTTPTPSTTDSLDPAIVTVTSKANNQAAASPTGSGEPSGAAAKDEGSHLTRNTIIAIVVVASCVGGAVVIWTVIRKWKFAPSEEFGDRLNPIDWKPTSSDGLNEKYAPTGLEGAGHRRRGSGGSNRSFVSADAHGNGSNHGHGGGYNAQPQHNANSMISDLPPHDFTAGATHGGYGNGLAPVGAYADLRRGPSPSPSMNGGNGNEYYRGYGATGYGGNGHSGY